MTERLSGRMNLRDVTGVVSEAQDHYVHGQIDTARQILESVIERLESVFDSDNDFAPGELMHARIWVMCVLGEMLSDYGKLVKAESIYKRVLSIARQHESCQEGIASPCFIDQLIEAGQALATVQGLSDQPAEALQTLKEIVQDIRRSHPMQRVFGYDGVLVSIDYWGDELGYSELSSKLFRGTDRDEIPDESTDFEESWTEPMPKLGEAYESYENDFSERVNELQGDKSASADVDRERLDDILRIVSKWLALVPRSAQVRRFELEMLIRKAAGEAESLDDSNLYDSWNLIEQKYRELVIDVPEYGALPRNMASRLCTLSGIVVTRRLQERERALAFYQFAIDREFDAFRMMESRKRASAMTQADALVWIELTNLMSYTYRDFGDKSGASIRTAARLIKIRNSFLRSLLKRDPHNEEGLRLRSQYGLVNSRVSLRALLFHSKWRWRIEAIEFNS
jgi:tetratricopeptide (TPR) repeat protein